MLWPRAAATTSKTIARQDVATSKERNVWRVLDGGANCTEGGQSPKRDTCCARKLELAAP
ncbi:hypothetical protein AKJ09_01930 [Labilithrix luteola]|uniref:Uncharacterized protein n=1 Tax=Labilithrix luteola TaxID=1391654 RepID=A0A0K1PPF4_9BACT|nr:hypothetical protein AKJ09_01930 [Labilithrix luteola]